MTGAIAGAIVRRRSLDGSHPRAFLTPFDTPDMARTVNWGVLGAAIIATERVRPAMNEAPSAVAKGVRYPAELRLVRRPAGRSGHRRGVRAAAEGGVDELIAARDRTGRHIEEALAYRRHPQWKQLDSRFVLGEAVPNWPQENTRDIACTIETLFASARTGSWCSL